MPGAADFWRVWVSGGKGPVPKGAVLGPVEGFEKAQSRSEAHFWGPMPKIRGSQAFPLSAEMLHKHLGSIRHIWIRFPRPLLWLIPLSPLIHERRWQQVVGGPLRQPHFSDNQHSTASMGGADSRLQVYRLDVKYSGANRWIYRATRHTVVSVSITFSYYFCDLTHSDVSFSLRSSLLLICKEK